MEQSPQPHCEVGGLLSFIRGRAGLPLPSPTPRIRRYHSSNRCAKLSICRRRNEPRNAVRTGTHWRRTHASSAGKSAAAKRHTTVGIERTTAGAAARRSGRLNAPARARRSLGGTSRTNSPRATTFQPAHARLGDPHAAAFGQLDSPQCSLDTRCRDRSRARNKATRRTRRRRAGRCRSREVWCQAVSFMHPIGIEED